MVMSFAEKNNDVSHDQQILIYDLKSLNAADFKCMKLMLTLNFDDDDYAMAFEDLLMMSLNISSAHEANVQPVRQPTYIFRSLLTFDVVSYVESANHSILLGVVARHVEAVLYVQRLALALSTFAASTDIIGCSAFAFRVGLVRGKQEKYISLAYACIYIAHGADNAIPPPLFETHNKLIFKLTREIRTNGACLSDTF